MKKVLYISYNFPPVGGSRVRRTLKFVKYLKEFGWSPVVLTVKKPYVPELDPTLTSEIPQGLEVVRTPSFELSWINKTKRAVRNDFYEEISGIERIMGRIIEKIKWSLFIPDPRITWIPFAVWSGLRIIRKENIEAIFVSGEPFSSFLSGVCLKKITGRPLIIEFRDEWSEFNEYFSYRTKPRWVKEIEKLLEKRVVEQSDRVISVTETIIENFRKRYPYLDSERFVCIPNGYDSEDFKDVKREKRRDKFVITYAGSLRGCRTPRYLFEAIEEWAQEEPGILEEIRFVYLGVCERDIRFLFDKEPIKNITDFLGFVDFKSTIVHLKSSDILVYLEDQIEIADRVRPAKLFEYAAAGRPILALAKGVSVVEVIQKSNAGIAVPPKDVKKIKDALKDMFLQYKNGRLGFEQDSEYIGQFDRRLLTGKLADALNSTLCNNPDKL